MKISKVQIMAQSPDELQPRSSLWNWNTAVPLGATWGWLDPYGSHVKNVRLLHIEKCYNLSLKQLWPLWIVSSSYNNFELGTILQPIQLDNWVMGVPMLTGSVLTQAADWCLLGLLRYLESLNCTSSMCMFWSLLEHFQCIIYLTLWLPVWYRQSIVFTSVLVSETLLLVCYLALIKLMNVVCQPNLFVSY